MQRNRLIAALAATALTALLVAAATSASGRRDRETRVEKAGISSDLVRPAEFPAGMPKVAGDPTRGDRKWAAKDQRDRTARRDRRDGDRRNGGGRGSDCNCWDQYPQTANINLKVLLIGADGSESGFADWQDTLRREGVPYTAIVARDAGELTASTFVDGSGTALYQAVIISNDGLYFFNGSAYVSALSASSWAALQAFETRFRIRQVTALVYAQPQYGLTYPTSAGDFGGTTAQVTAAGKAVFSNLTGTIVYDSGSWGYKATPLDPAFQTLVQTADGASVVGINTNPDGRQELVSTVAQNQFMTQSRLLNHGILSWVTRGVHLGANRNYLSLHVDDAFNGDDRWNATTNTTSNDDPAQTIVMTPADVVRAASWQRSSGMRLDLAFNGAAAPLYPQLASALIQNRRSFGWINHTFTHLNLDTVDTATSSAEIAQNVQFGKQNRLPFSPSEIVTGEHSGLNNPAIAAAFTDNGIAFAGSDASRESGQRAIGSALTVPRHPTNVFYNVGTRAEQLDEYNYVYYEACTSGCLSAPATWDQYVANEVAIMFRHVTGNDVNPHYFHVSNLAEDGVLFPVVDALLAQVNALYTTPIADPSLTDAGSQWQRQTAWNAALAAGQIAATLNGGSVTVSTQAGLSIPVTGVSNVERYGAERSGWTSSDGTLRLRVA